MSQSTVSRRVNQRLARTVRKRRQRHAAVREQVRLSHAVRVSRRAAVVAKVQRRLARRAQVWAAVVATPKKAVAIEVQRNERMVERPVLRVNKPVVSAAVAARRAAAEGVLDGECLDAAMRALSHNVVDYMERARAMRQQAEALVADAIGVPVDGLTKTVVCQYTRVEMDYYEAADVEQPVVMTRLHSMKQKALKAEALALGLWDGEKGSKLFGFETEDHRKCATWVKAIVAYHERASKVEATKGTEPTKEKIEVEVQQVVLTVDVDVEGSPVVEVINAQPVKNPISESAIKAAQKNVFTGITNPKLIGVPESRRTYFSPYAIKGAYFEKKAGEGSTHEVYPLNNSVLDALAVLRYGNPITLPAGMESGMEIVVPQVFTTEWEKAGLDENGKIQWKAKPLQVIPCLDLILGVSKQSEQKEVESAWSKRPQSVKDAATADKDSVSKALKEMGLNYRQCKAYKKLVNQTVFYLERVKSASVLCPAEIADVVIAYAKKFDKNLMKKLNRLVSVPTNWAMPKAGADYKRALGVFKVLEQGIQAAGFSNPITQRPLTFIEGQGCFVVWIGEHLSLLIESNGNVTVRDHSTASEYVVQPVMICAHRYYGEFGVDEVVMLNAIDQVLYHFENFHLFDLNRRYQMDSYRQVCGRASVTAREFQSSFIKYVKEAYVTERINPDWTPGHAMTRFRKTAKPVMLAMKGLLTSGADSRGVSSKASLVAATPVYGDFNESVNLRRQQTSLVTSMKDAKAVEIDTRAVIEAAYKNGSTVRPFGNCSGFADNNLYRFSAKSLPIEHQEVFVMQTLRNAWKGVWSDEAGREFLVKLFGDIPNLMEVACQQLVFANSDKVAKAIARVDKMSAPVDMRLEGMEFARFREVGEKSYKQVRPVRAGLMLQHPVHPGIGFLQPDTLLAEYVTSGRESGFFNPGKDPLKLSERLEAAAEPVETTSGIHRYSFKDLTVEFGECLGWFVDEDGVHTPIQAEQAGALHEVRFGHKTELSGSVFFVTLRYARKTKTHKLRLNIKLNAVAARVDWMLGRNQEDLAADLLVMQDCNKWFDLKQGGLFTIIAETFARHKQFRPLLLQANRLLKADTEVDNVLVYSRELRLTGAYNFLIDAFVEHFGKAVWWSSPVASDYSRFMYDLLSGIVGGGQDGWRVGEVDELLDGDIPEDAMIYTNAPATNDVLVDYDLEGADKTKITNVRSVVALWVDEEGVEWVAIRGFGFIGTENCPLYAPVISEYTAIEQSIVETDVLAFDMVDLALRGKMRLSADLMTGGDHARETHVALNTVLRGGRFLNSDGSVIPVVTVDSETEFFSAQEREVLATVENDAVAWFQKVVDLKDNVVYSLGGRSFYLPALARMGVQNVLSGEDTVVSKSYSFLRLIYNGYSPLDKNVGLEYARIFRMLETYLAGDAHQKSLVRGAKAVSCKVAGVPIVSTGTGVVVRGGQVESLMQRRMGRSVQNIMMWRPPIRNAAVMDLVYLDENLKQSTEFGKLYALGWYEFSGDRLYVGLDQNFNFGDYDGDPVKFINVTKYVRSGELEVDNYDTLMSFLESVVGIDMRSAEFWAHENRVEQFFADHFFIPSYKKVMKKMSIGVDCFKSETQWVDFLKNATEVQKVGVGLMYRMSTTHEMVAEMMNNAGLFDLDEEWAQSLTYLQGEAGRIYGVRCEQFYETALGGYGDSMVDSMVGYLARAVNGVTDTDESTLSVIKDRLTAGSNASCLGKVVENLVKFTHVSRESVVQSLLSLGFAESDFDFIEKAAILTALSREITKGGGDKGQELLQSSPTLCAVLSVARVVLNYSQNKHGDAGTETDLCFKLVEAVKESHPGFVRNLLSCTATGQLFSRLNQMRKAVASNSFTVQ
ncbi:hypothetical protein [Leptolyngbya sp. AN03gr2]|uniref:hypothetical protein n=1 Tax=Leptolyngbya sp. AN03gr2 TaxID=3423364 RepID=UPI003D318E2D